MKNIQIIDGATNCSFSIYAIPDRDFQRLFPRGHEIEFMEDAVRRLGKYEAARIMKHTSKGPLKKSSVVGIHGTLFIDRLDLKSSYPNRVESDLDRPSH